MSKEDRNNKTPDFEQLANLLVEEGIYSFSPADIHGVIAGHLAAGSQLSPEKAVEFVCNMMDINSFALQSSKVAITSLYSATCERLNSMDMDFDLLLPDDDNIISIRIEAMGQWCQSFLSGFGYNGNQTDKSLSKEALEALNDLGQIAQVASDAPAQKDDEINFVEVQEYVRMAVLFLFLDCNSATNNSSRPTSSDRLH